MDGNSRRKATAIFGLAILLTIVPLIVASCSVLRGETVAVEEPTSTPEPILPTRTPPASNDDNAFRKDAAVLATDEPIVTATAPNTPVASLMPTVEIEVTAVKTVGPQPPLSVASELDRFGVTTARRVADGQAAYAAGLPFGSILDWNVAITPPDGPVEYWQMVRVDQQGIRKTDWHQLAEAITANPNSYWLIGNEPDVEWQDNVTPERYAEIYHDVYSFIKERDPGAKIVVGGVSQPTPLRRAYLDIVLDTYEATYGAQMPIDVWNVHAFTLREEADSWGVGIPPGMEGEEGILYEIEDHDDVDIIAQNLRDFRGWMVERGYGDKPLVISEYGILMPEDYGFSVERVAEFQESTFDLFRGMIGEEGYAPDDNRLVQWWFWFNIYDSEVYTTGNLWDADTGQLTELGQAWSRYIANNAISTENQ